MAIKYALCCCIVYLSYRNKNTDSTRLECPGKKIKFNAVAVFFEKVFQLHKLSKKNLLSLEKLRFSYESLFNSEREPTLSIYCIFKNPDCYSSRTL